MTTKHITSLDTNAQPLATDSVAWMEPYWDAQAGLLWSPGDQVDPHHPHPNGLHMVRESGWYALGLLLRNNPGDLERAARALDTLLSYQFDEPGQPYHGTFYRAPEEPHPPAEPIEWKYYDPNWREFITTTLIIILQEYEAQLPRKLVQKIDAAIPKAIEGALVRPLKASYTNIALMNAFMLCSAGRRLDQPGWIEQGENMAQEIYRLFKLYDTFEEYNSPTYYGVDLYALALWKVYSTSSLLRELGVGMEATLWRDMARFYHAGLRNLCGPFDRSYGMDMRRYVALAGEWIGMVTGKAQSPYPQVDRSFAHAADLCFVPCVAILGAQPPPEVTPHFLAFQGERQVERIISDSPRRVATAWLGQNIMLGAECTSHSKRGYTQFHPATVHWKTGAQDVGWIRLIHSEPVDAHASRDRLEISGAGELTFQICASGVQTEMIRLDRWSLPGLSVQVETNARAMHIESGPNLIAAHYRMGGEHIITCALITRTDS